MPERFALAELQNVYEHVIGEEISRTLFRKRMAEGGLIVETGRDLLRRRPSICRFI